MLTDQPTAAPTRKVRLGAVVTAVWVVVVQAADEVWGIEVSHALIAAVTAAVQAATAYFVKNEV